MSWKILSCVLFFFGFVSKNNAQPPIIEWQKCYGGTGAEFAKSIQRTSDGGYIFVSSTITPNNGDVSGYHGANLTDYWVVKLDVTENIVWQKCFGGTGTDNPNSVQQTFDGGYIVGGSSNSTDGDVTGNHGTYDYWVLKLDSNGNISWKKALGGTEDETGGSIQQTSDSGYVVIGLSESIDGDGTANHGGFDCWIVRLDSSGNILWEKSFGGSEAESITTLSQTSDTGFIVSCYSKSIDGDVSNGWSFGISWIFKLDSIGNIQWQKTYGARLSVTNNTEYMNSINETPDGNYIATGTCTMNGGNVAGSHGANDIWAIKLSSTGNLLWQRPIGNAANQIGNNSYITIDSGCVIIGVSNGGGGEVTGQHNGADVWVVKLSKYGVLQWEKCYGGNSGDVGLSIYQTPDEGFITAGYTYTNSDADVGANHGSSDVWIVKLSKGISLPLRLGKFNAIPADKFVYCEWQTLQENNTNHFIIERSDNWKDFTAIGKVPAAGNSSLPLHYQFTDSSFLLNIDRYLYYRLKMVDNDAAFKYSNVIKVKLKAGTLLNIFPNPAHSFLTAGFSSTVTEKAVLTITDHVGRKLMSAGIVIKKGYNAIPVNISGMTKGTYFLSVAGTNKYIATFIKTSD